MAFARKPPTPSPDPSSLFEGLLRGVPDGKTKPAAAHGVFPAPGMLAGLARYTFDPDNPGGKVPIGCVNARMEATELPDGRKAYAAMGGDLLGVSDDRHHVVVAGSRSGKGRSHILPRLITDSENSFLTFTPKGDHARETARWRAEVLGQEVYVIDSHKTAGEGVAHLRATFNPLQHVDRDDPYAVVQAATDIAAAIVAPSFGGDTHWDDTAQEFIEGVIMHVLTADEYEGKRTLGQVRYQIMANADKGATFEDSGSLFEQMATSKAAFGAVQAAAASFFGKEDRERSSTLSTARKHLRFIGYPQIEEVLQDGPLDLKDLLSRKMSVYVCLPATMLGPAAGLLRLFVNLALSGFEKNENRHAHQLQSGGHRCHLLLDEYAAMGRLKSLETAAGQVAGLGCSLHIILQDLAQLKATHRQVWETFLGNAGTLCFFGNADLTTLQWLEKRIGTTEVRSTQTRTPSITNVIKEGEQGASYSSSNHPLMTMAEIAQTFDRDDLQARQLVFLPGIGPAIMHRMLYDKHEAFAPYRDWMRANA